MDIYLIKVNKYNEFVALKTLNVLRRIIGKEYFEGYSNSIDLHLAEYLAFFAFHAIHDSSDIMDVILVVSL